MKVQYCSDLHLEFPQNKDFLKSNPLQAEGDILILAGDIILLDILDKHMDFFSFVSDNFEQTYWIPGNHEYYYYDISKKPRVLNERITNNVSLVNNITLIHNNVKFIFSTLWSYINPENQWIIQPRISDFHVIKNNNELFTPSHFNDLHNESVQFIKNELHLNYTGKTIVGTHHVPTFANYPEKYKGDALNQAFAVELFDLIEGWNIDYWIFGHHHCNCDDFKINNTKLVTNQLGYVKYNEHIGFNGSKIIEI